MVDAVETKEVKQVPNDKYDDEVQTNDHDDNDESPNSRVVLAYRLSGYTR